MDTRTLPTRIRTDKFGDTWRVHTGKEAARLRADIAREAEVALARYDADRTPANLKAFAALADVEGEILRRTSKRNAA